MNDRPVRSKANAPATVPLQKRKSPDRMTGARSTNAPVLARGQKHKRPGRVTGALEGESDDDLLSREKDRTIIGAGAFHGPVRDGKGWFHSAMVVRH